MGWCFNKYLKNVPVALDLTRMKAGIILVKKAHTASNRLLKMLLVRTQKEVKNMLLETREKEILGIQWQWVY